MHDRVTALCEPHPHDSEFGWYVTEGLTPAARERAPERLSRFERHVSDCGRCGDKLADEAMFELALGAVADQTTEHRRPLAPWIGGALAAAALVLVIVLGRAAAERDSAADDPAMSSPADAGIMLAIDGDVTDPGAGPD